MLSSFPHILHSFVLQQSAGGTGGAFQPVITVINEVGFNAVGVFEGGRAANQ